MKLGAILCGFLALTLSTPAQVMAQAHDVSIEVVEESDGTRTLIHETVLDAPIAEVWATLTTEEGWLKWGPTFARFDLRNGGSIETGYHEGATPGDPMNIRHRILGMVPERMIVLKVEQAPARGPVSIETLATMWGVYELERLDEARTRLRISGIGYGREEVYSQMLEFFKAGNVYSIETLRKNLAAHSADNAAE